MVRARHGKSTKLAAHKRKWATVRSITAVAIVVVLFVTVAYVLNRDELTISAVVIEGNESVSTEDIQKKVIAVLDGSYSGLVPHASSIFYPRAGIRAGLLEGFKKIGAVRTSLADIHTIVVTVEEREPYAMWCEVVSPQIDEALEQEASQVTSLISSEDCLFLDSDGFAFADAPIFSDSVYFQFYDDRQNKRIPLVGKSYLDRAVFNTLSRFLARLNSTEFRIASLTLSDEEIQIGLGDGGVLKFSEGQDLNKLLDSINVVIESDAFRVKDLSQLEYIDLRFGNKVYYRFYGEEQNEQ